MAKITNNAKQSKTIRLYPQLLRRLKAVSKRYNITQQKIIEMGITMFIEELEKGGDILEE